MPEKYPNLYHIIREIGADNNMQLLAEPNWSSIDFSLRDHLKNSSLDDLEDIAGMMTPEERVVFATGESQEIWELSDKYDKEENMTYFMEECFDGDFTDAFFDKPQIA